MISFNLHTFVRTVGLSYFTDEETEPEELK